MFKVRGMGVAERVSTSTWRASFFSFSLWPTPKRCSSSTTRSPRSWKRRSFPSSLWVPMSRSTDPSWVRRRMSRAWAAVRKRESISISTGKWEKRFRAVM